MKSIRLQRSNKQQFNKSLAGKKLLNTTQHGIDTNLKGKHTQLQ